jgi:alpha-L-fucosidase
MKNIFVCLFISLQAGFAFHAVAADAIQMNYGLFIHYGLPTFAHPGEEGVLPANRFAPVTVDVKSWARTAKEAGMTFAILTAKHESGFCLWDSKDNDYGVGGSPFKGDILRDFIAACEAEGIAPGIYYSVADAHNDDGVKWSGPVGPRYFAVIKKHLVELNTKYPGLRIILLPGMVRFSNEQFNELRQTVSQLNPQCLVPGNGPKGRTWQDCTVNEGWFWGPNKSLKTPEEIFKQYSAARAKGAPFILNVGADPAGRIPENYAAVLMEMKRLIAQGSTAAKPNATDRLKQVKSLYDQGLINKEDYDKKVKEIVDSL